MDVVLLGFIDQQISGSSPISWDTNKIGGSPSWITEPADDVSLRCDVCNLPKTFVGQFYCPLRESAFHRTLYLFVCCRCHQLSRIGSWTVLRLQCVAEENSSGHAETDDSCRPSGTSKWCCDADDWDVDTCDTSSCCGDRMPASNRHELVDHLPCSKDIVSPTTNVADVDASLSSALQDASLADETKPGDGSSDQTKQLLMHLTIDNNHFDNPVSIQTETSTHVQSVSQVNTAVLNTSFQSTSEVAEELEPYYVYVVEESDVAAHSDHVDKLLTQYRLREQSSFIAELESENHKASGGEKYEKGNVHHGDYVFYKFTQKISINPNQIVRYCRNGRPLFAGLDARDVILPSCRCGTKRSFELQLMPALVHVLRRPWQSEPLVEFLTVLIYTCSENCWTQEAKFVEEFALVEYDRDSRRVNEAWSNIAANHSS